MFHLPNNDFLFIILYCLYSNECTVQVHTIQGGGVEPGALLSLNRDSHSVVDFSTLSLNKNCFCPF